jgi:hypothetical protein
MRKRLLLPLCLVLFLLLLSPVLACLDASECATDEGCEPASEQCYLASFVTLTPNYARLYVGESKSFTASMRSPMGTMSTFDLALSGNGKYFAKFAGGSSSLSVVLSNDTKKVPLLFRGGAVGNYVVCVDAVDSTLPAVNNSAASTSLPCAQIQVETGKGGIFSITTPSLGLPGIVALLLLASAYFLVRRDD